MEKVREKEKEFRKGDSGPKYLFRGPHAEWGVIVLKPGEKMGCHGHQKVVEDFYFLEGSPLIIIDGAETRVEPGEAIRSVPPEKHDIYNDTAEPIKLVFIKAPYLPHDKISS